MHQLLTGIDPAGSMTPPTQSTGNIRLDLIWRKATNPDPSQRYATVAAMSADLEKWIAAKQKSAHAPAARPSSALGRPVPVQTSGGGSAGKFFLIGVLGALIVAAYLVLKDRKEVIDATAAGNGTVETPTPEPEAPAAPVSRPPEVHEPMPEPDPIEIVENDDEEEPEEAEEPEEMADADDEPEPEPIESVEPGDPELRERAVGLIGEAREKRDKELADNVSILRLDLKSLSRSADSDLVKLIERLREDIVDNRIPVIDGVSGLPDKVASAFKDSLAEEESIDTKCRADLTRIRDAYVTRLKGASDEASEEDLKERLLTQAEEAEDLDEWIAALSPEPEREVRKSSGGLAGGFVGKWEIHGGNAIERWIAHPDGRLEVVGQKWEVAWVVLDDGTLEIRWPDKKPFVMKGDGEDWVGKSPFGAPVTFKPGDW